MAVSACVWENQCDVRVCVRMRFWERVRECMRAHNIACGVCVGTFAHLGPCMGTFPSAEPVVKDTE